jgi:hypothetical protein
MNVARIRARSRGANLTAHAPVAACPAVLMVGPKISAGSVAIGQSHLAHGRASAERADLFWCTREPACAAVGGIALGVCAKSVTSGQANLAVTRAHSLGADLVVGAHVPAPVAILGVVVGIGANPVARILAGRAVGAVASRAYLAAQVSACAAVLSVAPEIDASSAAGCQLARALAAPPDAALSGRTRIPARAAVVVVDLSVDAHPCTGNGTHAAGRLAEACRAYARLTVGFRLARFSIWANWAAPSAVDIRFIAVFHRVLAVGL